MGVAGSSGQGGGHMGDEWGGHGSGFGSCECSPRHLPFDCWTNPPLSWAPRTAEEAEACRGPDRLRDPQ